MTSSSSPSSTNNRETTVENELDLHGLFCLLWHGKLTILCCALLLALAVLVYASLVRQEWTATAITDKPTVNLLGGYFFQQQFLRNLDVKNTIFPTSDILSIADEAYQEFLCQLASYDTRRDFWLDSPYYTTRKERDVHANAVLLDELINTIQFHPRNDMKKLPDTTKLIAKTAVDANQLLRRYVDYSSQRAANHLNEEMMAAWTSGTLSLKTHVKRQEAVANAVYNRELK